MVTEHTTGINWESVATIVSCVAVTMSLIIGAFAKVISSQITRAIDKFRIQVIAELHDRVTKLEVESARRWRKLQL